MQAPCASEQEAEVAPAAGALQHCSDTTGQPMPSLAGGSPFTRVDRVGENEVERIAGAAASYRHPGSVRSSCSKSTVWSLDSCFAARFFVAFISATCDDGTPHRGIASSRTPSDAFRTTGACDQGRCRAASVGCSTFAGRVWALWLAGRLAFQAEFLFIAFAEFFQN
jgi:hypothetical protein